MLPAGPHHLPCLQGCWALGKPLASELCIGLGKPLASELCSPCRPSTGAGVAAWPGTAPAWEPTLPAQPALSREDLVEPSLAGTSSLIFPPQAPQASSARAPSAGGRSSGPSPRSPRARPALPPVLLLPQPQQGMSAGAGAVPRPLRRSRTSLSNSSPHGTGGALPLARRATVGQTSWIGEGAAAGAGSGSDGPGQGRGVWGLGQLLSPKHSRQLSLLSATLGDGAGLAPLSRQGSFSVRRRTSRCGFPFLEL
jgi:hypothetical protein